MTTYFAIQGRRKGQWQILQFCTYDDGIGWLNESVARGWVKMYPHRNWRIVKRVLSEEVVV